MVYNPQIDATNSHLAVMAKGQTGIQHELQDIRAEIRRHGSQGEASKSAFGASVRTRKQGT